MARCRSCNAVIFWNETPSGKRCPFDPDGESHFKTCPDARDWSRRAEPQAPMFDADDPTLAPRPEGERYPR